MSNSEMAGSVGVVLPFANRDPLLTINLMRTLAAQTRRPDAVALVNFGKPCPRLEAIKPPFPYIYRHIPQGELWSLTLANNQGARLLPPVETTMFLDADALMAADFIERGLRRLKPGVLVKCRILDLPREAVTPETNVVRDFQRLKGLAKLRKEITAVGGCQWLRTKALHKMRGHDEAFKMWCFEDMDFLRRARWLGLQPAPMEDETTLLHQWHPSKEDVIKDPNSPQVKAARYWYRTNLLRLRARAMLWDIGKFDSRNINPGGWGRIGDGSEAETRGVASHA